MQATEQLILDLLANLGKRDRYRKTMLENLLSLVDLNDAQKNQKINSKTDIELLLELESIKNQALSTGQFEAIERLDLLSQQLREDLRELSLSIHYALMSKGTINKASVDRLGEVLLISPESDATEYDLLEMGRRFHTFMKDCNLIRKLLVGEEAEQALQYLFEETPDTEALKSYLRDLDLLQSDMSVDESELKSFSEHYQKTLSYRINYLERRIAELIEIPSIRHKEQIISLIQENVAIFGNQMWRCLESFRSNYPDTVIELLIHSENQVGLQLLLNSDIPASSHDLFSTLMTIRFGDQKSQSVEEWKEWLSKYISSLKHQQSEELIDFWSEHRLLLPDLLSGTIDAPEISNSLRKQITSVIGATPLQEFIDRVPEKIRPLLEGFIQAEEAKKEQIAAKIVQIKEQKEVLQATEQEVIQKTEALEPIAKEISPIIETAAETVADAIISDAPDEIIGNVVETAIETGLETAGVKSSVSFEAEKDSVLSNREDEKALEQIPSTNIWTEYLRPFFTENAVFIVAGAFIYTGLFLLIFYLWNSEAWVRYGVVPATLIAISISLSRAGSWFQNQDVDSKTPNLILQTVAIMSAPISLQLIGILSIDQQLAFSTKLLWGSGLILFLMAAWYWIFSYAGKTVLEEAGKAHAVMLLMINAILLILPITYFMSAFLGDTEGIYIKPIIIIGFYGGFLLLIFNTSRILNTSMTFGGLKGRRESFFYAVTCLGTLAGVWILTHVRLSILPMPQTYGPLLILSAYLVFMFEVRFRKADDPYIGLNLLSYLEYILIIISIALCLVHVILRPLAFLLAGFFMAKQSGVRSGNHHYEISILLLIIGFSSLAFIPGFQPIYFPFLVLLVATGLYLTGSRYPTTTWSKSARGFSLIYISLGVFLSLGWQWYTRSMPLPWGIGLLLFGIFTILVGGKEDSLALVNSGAIYAAIALPYLGFANMVEFSLQRNTLPLGFALLGGLWTLLSSKSRFAAIKDNRATVLWGIGMIAFSMMILHLVVSGRNEIINDPILLIGILCGPIILSFLMFLAGYYTRSQLPVYLALVILVVIFPEIKRHIKIFPGSGLGLALSAVFIIAAVIVLVRWNKLRDMEPGERIWRQVNFPLQALNHRLFTTPLALSTLFLLTQLIFWVYPRQFNFW